MNKYFKHFKTILIHKYWVFYFARRCGITWQGIKHDFSKFSPVEFLESVKYYTGTRSPIDTCKEANGYSLAWQFHKGRNPHHYEFWQDNFDKGTTHIDMPDKYVKEMICDFLAAGRAYNGNKFTFEDEYRWWKNRLQSPIALHPRQFYIIDSVISAMYTRWKDKHIEDLESSDWSYFRHLLDSTIKSSHALIV